MLLQEASQQLLPLLHQYDFHCLCAVLIRRTQDDEAMKQRTTALEAEINSLSKQLEEGRWNVELLDRKCTIQVRLLLLFARRLMFVGTSNQSLPAIDAGQG